MQDTDEEEEEEYVNNIVIEPQARVVLESSERTETKMTEEMAELADRLKTPLAVYEYLYNNLNTEYYIGSRKGAIGTYEQKSGNDVDASSLLVAMLRYLGNEAQSINSARAYIDPISIQYVPCEDFYDTLGDILDIEKPANIYSPISNDYIVTNQKTICPALYLDNEKVLEWKNARVSIGEKQKVTIATSTGGQQHRFIETRELIVGSIISVVIDTQIISPQTLLTAYENYKKIKDTINENNFFESSYCDNYLNFIGNAYFAQLDAQNSIYASAYDVYKERELSFGLFSYEPVVDIRSTVGFTTSITLTKKGNFGIDILGAYNQALSLNGNAEDTKSYLFGSGYASSYLESKTLQQFTGVKTVSTAEVFRQCTDNGIELKMISSKNKYVIDTLQISTEDKNEITQLVDDGNLVIVPEKNITINEWTGTGYIVQNSEGTSNTFIITGDKNGGYTTMDLAAYMTITTIGAGVDMFTMVFGFVSLVTALIASPIGIVVACAVTVIFAYLVVAWVQDYQETVNLYFRALDGDESTADKLNGKAFLSFVFMAFDFASGGISGSKGAGPDDIPTPGGRMADLADQGYGDDVIKNISNMKNVDSCSDELLESIAKSGKSAEVADTLSKCSDDVIEALNKSPNKDTAISLIAKHGDDAVSVSAKSSSDTLEAIANLSDEAAESFFKTAGKNSDELISAINKSSNIDEAVSFVSKYADDGAEIFLRHGDDAIAAVKGCDAPYKAVQIIKNGGLQYGEQAAQAIKKSGDKAIEALTKVPTKVCAELIAKHGDEAADVFVKYGDEAVEAVKVLDDESAELFFKHSSLDDDATSEIIDYLHNGNTSTLSEDEIRHFLSDEVIEAEEELIISSKQSIYRKDGRITALQPNNTYVTGSDSSHAL